MAHLQFVNSKTLLVFYAQQLALQAALIEMQQEVIRLQNKLDKMKPDTPLDEEVFWHVASGGGLSTEAANSKNVDEVQKFLDWNLGLAKKYVKPHVNPKVYGEVVNQMTRGLPERIAELKTRSEINQAKANKKSESGDRIIQLALIQDA